MTCRPSAGLITGMALLRRLADRHSIDAWLVSLVVFSLALNAVFIGSLWRHDVEARQPIMDSAYFAELAELWAAGGAVAPEGGLFLLAPGYSVFLAFVVRLVGTHWLAVYMIQALLNAVALGLLARFATRCAPRWAAYCAVLLLTLYGPYQLYAASLLSEALVVPVIGTFFWLFDRRRWSAVQGALLGFAYLLRPNLGLFLIALLLWLAWRDRRRLRSMLWVLAFLFVIPAVHWATTGRALGGSAQSAVALYMGNHPGADGLFTNSLGLRGSIPEMAEQLEVVTENRVGRELEPHEINRYWTGEVVRWLREDPGAFFQNLVLKALRLLDNHEYATDHQWLRDFPPAARLFPVPFGLLAALAAAGLTRAGAFSDRLAPVVIYLLTGLAGLLIFFPSARLRFALVPSLIVLAAVGLESLRRFRFRAVVACAVVLVMAAVGVRDHRRSEDAFGHFNRARAFLAEGRVDSARRFLDRALAVNWNVSFFHVLRAEILRREGRQDAAELALRVAFLLGENDAEVINRVAATALARQRWSFAETVFRRAIEVYPSAGASYMNLCQVLIAQGRLDEARTVYRRAVDLGSGRRRELEEILGR